MFMLFSLVFDIYKKSCMYLASSDENISPESFKKKKKILTCVMIAIQLTFGTYITTLVIIVLLASFVYGYAYFHVSLGKLENIGIASMFLIVFILYIIVLRKLIFTLSKKYPKFYQQERKHILTTTSIILASIGMRIIRFALFSTEFFSDAMEESY
jgi:hypothetical protein